MLTILRPAGWPRPSGYSHAMIGQGRVLLTGGQIGWDAEGKFAEGLVGQTRQALRNIVDVLAEAQAGPGEIARMVWYVTDMPSYRSSGKALGAVWREVMGKHFPAMAVIGATCLVEPDALVEIEATAILP